MVEASSVVSVPVTAERLTWDDVRGRYPDQWVTLVDIDWVNETDFDFRSALAIGHGTRRAEAMTQARPLLERYAGFGCFFTGRIRALRRAYLVA